MDNQKAINETSNIGGNISWFRIIIGSALLFCGILIIDIHNFPSIIMYIFNSGNHPHAMEDISVFLIVASVIAVALICRSRILSLLKMPCCSFLDELQIMAMISCLAILFTELRLNILSAYKLNWLYLFFLVFGLLIAFRWDRYINVPKLDNEAKRGIVDLRDFLSEDFEPDEKPILFSEEAAEYDLLNREGIVTLVANYIVRCNSKHVFTIGLCGPWGCGKTTVLNLVKERLITNGKNVVVVDDFDPWMYGTKGAMLGALYETILKNTGIQFSFIKGKRLANSLLNTVADSFKVPSLSKYSKEWVDEDYSVKSLKQQIGIYLRRRKRKIVILIDNLDRAESFNILFLFKIIGSVLDLPNIVYVLAYDKDRVNGVFKRTEEANVNYLEKIVQQEINVSNISDLPLRQIARRSVLKAIREYSVQEDAGEYEAVIGAISENIKNLRQLKRLLNSVFVSTFCHENSLYKPHLLAIETIRFLEKDLYDSIRMNPQFFVSRDVDYDFEERFKGKNAASFKDTAKLFFDELLGKYSGYKNLLASLFPNVGRYILHEDITADYEDAPIHKSVASIASLKYFELYFSYDSNYYLDVIDNVNEFINTVNELPGNRESYIEDTINSVPSNEKNDWLCTLQVKVAEIDESKRLLVAERLQKTIKNMDESSQYGRYAISQRALAVLTKLLSLLGNGDLTSEVLSILDRMTAEYNYYELKGISDWCDFFNRMGEGDFSNIKNYAITKYGDVCNRIVTEKIDIYSDKLFHVDNQRYLYAFLDGREGKFKEYISSILCEENAIRIVRSMLWESIEFGKFRYTLKKATVNEFVEDPEIVWQTLIGIGHKSSDETKIVKLWANLFWGEEEHDEEFVVLGHRLRY